MNFDVIELHEMDICKDAAHMLGYELCKRYTALPIKREDNILFVAMASVHQSYLCDIFDATGCYVVPWLAKEAEIHYFVNAIFSDEHVQTVASQFLVDERLRHVKFTDENLLKEIQNAPAVKLLDSLIDTGIAKRASDIHIEPFGNVLRARYRIDGKLITFTEVDVKLLPNIISRLKIMGNMDIAETRFPQDGHFTYTEQFDRQIEFRVSTLPTASGEKAAIRLLYGSTSRMHKNELGFFQEDLTVLDELFGQPHGAIFMTGPTGSGKSTTLNCFLESLNSAEKNIITVEQPVEHPIMGVNHLNIEKSAGLSFGNALKHILRQDPDIIMIGEMRDEETAHIAIQAAITGHVVLSTLHTNDAAGVIERLLDMGIPAYLVASSVCGVISQRLVRKICDDCIVNTYLTDAQATALSLDARTEVFYGTGCAKCNDTGYKGRFAVYEYFILNDALRHEISHDPNEFAIRQRAKKLLKQNAIKNLLMGRTTAEEVLTVIAHE